MQDNSSSDDDDDDDDDVDDDDDDDEAWFSSSSCLVLPQMPVNSHWTQTQPTDDSLCPRTTER